MGQTMVKYMYISNVHRDLANQISGASGISSTTDLGKYLGMPVLHKRINKNTFREVLERVSSRLSGWKGRFLSFAGRLTLTKSVLSSIPVHSMSTIALPKSTLGQLDRVSRSFLWGSTTEKRKLHLVAWNRVCLPKHEEGLGVRSSNDMNKALLAKVGWRLLHDKTSLWAKVLRAKYKVGDVHDQSWLVVKSAWSSTWRSIGIGLRECVLPELRFVLGDGKEIRFWSDRWLTKTPLVEMIQGVLPEGSADIRVKDLWREGTGWLLSRITPYVTATVRLQLAAVVLDNVTGATDRLSWGGTADGSFTVKSAYAALTRYKSQKQSMGSFFEKIWKMVAPERVRLFTWLTTHQVLMTNVERNRRHMSESNICPVCSSGEETIIHVLRDCPSIAGIWQRLVHASRMIMFFQKSLLEWLYWNLKDGTERDGVPWSTLFAMIIWWAWKWRCGEVFGGMGRCRDRVKFINELAKDVYVAHSAIWSEQNKAARVVRLVSWTPPHVGWVKLNTDGAAHGNPGLATAGGVLRDGDGNWKGGFALNIGICSAPLAELWGVYYGLYIAWERGITRLELKVDSEIVVGFLRSGISDAHPLSFLVRLCYGFISRDWIVRISHVYREANPSANRLADGLANYAFTLPLGFHSFDASPDVVRLILLEDISGSSHPRSVRL